MNSAQVHQIWLQTAELVKDRVVSPTIYRALERGVGIALDGDDFILGFEVADLPMAGNLRSAQNQTIIEQCLKQVLNKPVRLKIIEGTTSADYEHFKKTTETLEQQRLSMEDRRNQDRVVEQSWDEIGEHIARAYARTPFRTYSQQRAIFMRHAFKLINDGVNKLGYTNDSNELEKRCLARVFDKLAQVTEVPSAMLAYEYFKLREEGKLK